METNQVNQVEEVEQAQDVQDVQTTQDAQTTTQSQIQPQEFVIRMPKLPAWKTAEEIGYEPKTTFWQDFCIAERFGVKAIQDTFMRAFDEWQEDVIYTAELALVLNHKGWWFYNAYEIFKQKGDTEGADIFYNLSQLYFRMFDIVNDYSLDYFTGDDADYYYEVTD